MFTCPFVLADLVKSSRNLKSQPLTGIKLTYHWPFLGHPQLLRVFGVGYKKSPPISDALQNTQKPTKPHSWWEVHMFLVGWSTNPSLTHLKSISSTVIFLWWWELLSFVGKIITSMVLAQGGIPHTRQSWQTYLPVGSKMGAWWMYRYIYIYIMHI